ncbi:MAG: hypothetical protein WBW41_13255 [Verrucomicrobiia bacterium]
MKFIGSEIFFDLFQIKPAVILQPGRILGILEAPGRKARIKMNAFSRPVIAGLRFCCGQS